MHWNDAPNAGFTTGKPWLKVNSNYTAINVKQQDSAPNSVLAYYRNLLRWRKQTPALHTGTYRDLLPDHPLLWAFERTLTDTRLWVIANFSAEVTALPGELTDALQGSERILSNYQRGSGDDALQPYEARVYNHAERS